MSILITAVAGLFFLLWAVIWWYILIIANVAWILTYLVGLIIYLIHRKKHGKKINIWFILLFILLVLISVESIYIVSVFLT